MTRAGKPWPAGGGRSLAVRIGLGGAVVGLVAVAVGTSFAGRSDEAPESTTTTTPELTGGAAELADLLELRQEQVYHARYEGSSVDSASIVIETWQDAAGRVRQDQILSANGQRAHLVALDGDDGPVRCTQVTEQEWSCRRTAREALDDPIASIRSRLSGDQVRASDEQVDGSAARCFQLGEGADRSELCVRPATGIPVRISAGETELRLVRLEEVVDPATFEPPGPLT